MVDGPIYSPFYKLWLQAAPAAMLYISCILIYITRGERKSTTLWFIHLYNIFWNVVIHPFIPYHTILHYLQYSCEYTSHILHCSIYLWNSIKSYEVFQGGFDIITMLFMWCYFMKSFSSNEFCSFYQLFYNSFNNFD